MNDMTRFIVIAVGVTLFIVLMVWGVGVARCVPPCI